MQMSHCLTPPWWKLTVAPKRRLNQKSLTSFSTKQPKKENNFDKQGSESAKDVNVSDVTTTEEETLSEDK